jgi:hypothetical protein
LISFAFNLSLRPPESLGTVSSNMKNESYIQNGSSHFISDIKNLEIDEIRAIILPQRAAW